MRTSILLFLYFFCSMAFAQGRYGTDLEMNFKSGTYTMKSATYYNRSNSDAHAKEKKGSLVLEGYMTNTFVEYQQLFLEGECHVTEATYYDWKEGIGVYEPVILATFILEQGSQKYSITKYMLQYGNKEYLAAQLHKKVKGKWYYPGLDDNINRLDLINFFTAVQQSFFDAYQENRQSLLSNNSLFTKDKLLKSEELVKAYDDKYRQTAPMYEATNFVFEDRVRQQDQSRKQSEGALANYFRKSSIVPSELEYLLTLLDASLTGQAVSHFSKLTGVSLIQLLEECPNALNQ